MTRWLKRDFLYRAIKVALLVALVAYFVPTGGLVKGVYDFPWRVANQLALGLLFGGWLLWKLRKGQGPVRTSLDWVIAAWLALTLLTTLFSLDQRMSWEMVAYVGAHVLWYYIALDLFRREGLLNDTVAAVVIVGTAIAVLGVVEFIGIGYILRLQSPSSYRVQSILLNPNVLGAFLCLTFGFTLYHLSNVESRAAGRGWTGALTIIFAVILLTRSRGAWFNLAVMVSSMAGIGLMQIEIERVRQRRRLLWVGFVIIGITLLLLVVLNNRPFTNRVRVATWQAALQMVADRPLQGGGPGMYGRLFLAYRDPQELPELHAHAHNIVLLTMAEMGIATVPLLTIGALLWSREVWHRLRHSSPGSDRWQRTVALATLAGFLAHSQLDSFFHYPMFAFLIMPLVARLNAHNRNVHRSRLELLFHALTLGVAAVIVIQTTPAYALYHRARIASERNDWEQTGEYLSRAVATDPSFLFYQRQLAIARGLSALEHRPVREEDYYGFTDVFKFSDDFAPDRSCLACLEFLTGDLSTAITEMERAQHLDPRNTLYTFNLGMYYEAAGQVNRAKELYEKVVTKDPSLLASNFWSDTTERKAMLPSLIQHALLILPEDNYAGRGDILANAGEWEAAKKYYDLQIQTDNPVSGWIGMARLALANNDVVASLEHIERALALEPENKLALLVRARAHLADGNATTAADDLEAIYALGTSPEALFYWGETARMQGDWATAKRRYLEAIGKSMRMGRSKEIDLYAQLIGRRLPMATENVECLEWPYLPEALSLPVARLLDLYQRKGDEEALRNLQQMLPYSMRCQIETRSNWEKLIEAATASPSTSESSGPGSNGSESAN